jgi:hypothetical protein
MYAPLLVGLAVAVAVFAYGWQFRLDRSRAFYTVVLMVVASYYVLFAAMGGSTGTLVTEVLIMGCFAVLSTVGHARSMWLVVIGLAGHGVLDMFHGEIVANPGVPQWWPPFCMGYDLLAAAGLALLLSRRRVVENNPGRGVRV